LDSITKGFNSNTEGFESIGYGGMVFHYMHP